MRWSDDPGDVGAALGEAIAWAPLCGKLQEAWALGIRRHQTSSTTVAKKHGGDVGPSSELHSSRSLQWTNRAGLSCLQVILAGVPKALEAAARRRGAALMRGCARELRDKT